MSDNSKKIAKLVAKMQNGDMSVFDELYESTKEAAIFTSLCICKNRDDAEDIVQESYVYLFQKVNDIKNPEAFMSWFNMVVASKTKNMLRKKNPVLFDSNESEEFILDSIEDNDKDFHPSEDYEHTELREEVMELVDDLSEEKRTAIVLFYYDEMTTKQIAESLGINENTVKSRLVQAKKDLAKGVKTLEKKNKSLYGIAPIPLVIWALRSSAKVTGESFTAGGGSAAVLSAIKSSAAGAAASGTAVAGTAATTATGGVVAKIAGLSVAQKIISGVVVAGIVTGGAVGTKAVITQQRQKEDPTTTTEVQMAVSPIDEEQNATDHVSEIYSEKLTTTELNSVSNTTTGFVTTESVTAASVQKTTKATKTTTTTKHTTTTTTAKKVKLNVSWRSFSGDEESGSYMIEVPQGTTITKDIISEQLISQYQLIEVINGNSYLNIPAENDSYSYELYVS